MLTINEIFHSIQGESTYVGAPCVFVRLTACDLRCTWCDTAYAFEGGERLGGINMCADRQVVDERSGHRLDSRQIGRTAGKTCAEHHVVRQFRELGCNSSQFINDCLRACRGAANPTTRREIAGAPRTTY